MALIVKGPDLNTIHDKMAMRAALGPVDAVASSSGQLFDIMALAETCEYDFDLKDIWTRKSRWDKLCRQYIDPEAYEEWLDKCEFSHGRNQGHSFLRTNTVAGRVGTRQWGSCLVGFGFRVVGKRSDKPTLILHSRTTYLGYIAQLDLALVHVIARDIAERCGITVGDIAFTWNVEAAQLHGFRSMAWWFQTEERANLLRGTSDATPHKAGLALARREFQNGVVKKDEIGELYGDGSFMSRVRLRKHYHTEVLGIEYAEQFEGGTRYTSRSARSAAKPLPSVPVSSLKWPATKRVIQEGRDGAGLVWDVDEVERAMNE